MCLLFFNIICEQKLQKQSKLFYIIIANVAKIWEIYSEFTAFDKAKKSFKSAKKNFK